MAKSKEAEEREFRMAALCREEVQYLLKLSKQEVLKFPLGLQARLIDLMIDFDNQILKLKEITVRSRANSFWEEEKTAVSRMLEEERQARKKRHGETYADIIAPSADQMRKLLNKERAKYAKPEKKPAHKAPRKGPTTRKPRPRRKPK